MLLVDYCICARPFPHIILFNSDIAYSVFSQIPYSDVQKCNCLYYSKTSTLSSRSRYLNYNHFRLKLIIQTQQRFSPYHYHLYHVYVVNTHNVKLIPLTTSKCTIHWYLVYSQFCIPINTIQFQNIFITLIPTSSCSLQYGQYLSIRSSGNSQYAREVS